MTDVSRAQTREKLHFLWAHQGTLSIRDSFVKHKRRKWVLGREIECKSTRVWSNITFFGNYTTFDCLKVASFLHWSKASRTQLNSIHQTFVKCLLCGRASVRCFSCIISLNPCSSFFSLHRWENWHSERWRVWPRNAFKSSVLSTPSYSLPPQQYQPTTAELFFPRSYPSGKMSSQQTSRPIGVTLYQETLSTHSIVSFPPWETRREHAYRVVEFSILGPIIPFIIHSLNKCLLSSYCVQVEL